MSGKIHNKRVQLSSETMAKYKELANDKETLSSFISRLIDGTNRQTKEENNSSQHNQIMEQLKGIKEIQKLILSAQAKDNSVLTDVLRQADKLSEERNVS